MCFLKKNLKKEKEKNQCLTKFTSVLYVAKITGKFLVLILLDFSLAFGKLLVFLPKTLL